MIQRYITPSSFLSVLLAFFGFAAFGQKDTTRLNQEVEVVKAYRPTVSGAAKINLLPEINDTTTFRPDLNYRIVSHPVAGGYKASVLKASSQFQREVKYPGYGKISGGFGSYITPFVDLYLNNPNMQNGTIGIQLNHISSMGGNVRLRGGSTADVPYSSSKAAVFGSFVAEGVTISSDITYQRDNNRYYGYPVEIPADIMTNNFVKYFSKDQVHQLGNFNFMVKSNTSSSSALKFDAGINLGYFNTTTEQVEKATCFKGDFSYDFGGFTGKLRAGFAHYETENVSEDLAFSVVTSPKSSWLQLSPVMFYQNETVAISGGVNLFAVFNVASGTTFKPYPKADLSLRLADNSFSLYAGLDGSLSNNTYSKIAKENRYINPFLYVKPTNRKYVVSGGVKGKIATPLAFNLGIKYGKAEDEYFFVTRVENRSGNASPSLADLTYNNAFEVVYDDLGTMDFSADLSYVTSSVFLLLSGHFYNYQVTSLEKPLYKPDFILNTSSEFKVTDQLSAIAELFFTGPRNVMLQYYLPPVASSLPPPPIYLKADAMTELNLGAKYRITDHLHFIGRIENLLNRKDEPWYGYTVQGIRFKVGASLTF
jgi:hypothetical protein